MRWRINRYWLFIPLTALVLGAGLFVRPRHREMARQSVLEVYGYAQRGDYDFGYSSDLSGARHDLQDLEAQYGRVQNFRLTGESLLAPMQTVTFTLTVTREKGTFEEAVSVFTGYTKSYSRDFVAFRSITSTPVGVR